MTALETGRRLVDIFREEDVPFMAASIAFYAIASFVPLLLFALAVVSFFGATDVLIEVLRAGLSESGGQLLDTVLSNAAGHGVAGGVGFLLTLWSGIKVFRGLTVAFDEIYTVPSDLSILEQVVKSLLALGVLFVGVVLLSATGLALAFVDLPVPYPTLFGNVLATVVLALAFLPIFYIMPPTPVTLGHAVPGAVVTAIGWVLLQVGFYYYAGSASRYAAYGFLGAVLLAITFLYLGAIVLLVGAVVNYALDR